MSQLDIGSSSLARQKPTSNIYTVMVLVAFVALTTAVCLMWVKNTRLTEGDRPSDQLFLTAPFYVIPAK